jgi:hypothetical protein
VCPKPQCKIFSIFHNSSPFCPSARTHPSAFLFLDFLSQLLSLRLSHFFLFIYFFPISLSFPSRITHSPPSLLLIPHTHTHGSCFTHTYGLGVDFWVFLGIFLSIFYTHTHGPDLSLSPSASPSSASSIFFPLIWLIFCGFCLIFCG